MGKQVFSALGGALVLSEAEGVFTLSFDEALGGGEAAGILKGQGSLVLDGKMGLQLGEKLLNSHLPPAVVPLAQVIEGVANQAIQALE